MSVNKFSAGLQKQMLAEYVSFRLLALRGVSAEDPLPATLVMFRKEH